MYRRYVNEKRPTNVGRFPLIAVLYGRLCYPIRCVPAERVRSQNRNKYTKNKVCTPDCRNNLRYTLKPIVVAKA